MDILYPYDWHNDHLMLFFTGVTRIASTVAGEKIANLHKREKQLFTMGEMVNEARTILTSDSRPIDEIGRLLHDSWRLKQELASNVSTPEINALYEAALNAGATGGKLLGAGGGGFMVIFCPPENQPAVREALGGLIEVKVKIGSQGSTIAVYEPDLSQP